jgi:hypothetical protein
MSKSPTKASIEHELKGVTEKYRDLTEMARNALAYYMEENNLQDLCGEGYELFTKLAEAVEFELDPPEDVQLVVEWSGALNPEQMSAITSEDMIPFGRFVELFGEKITYLAFNRF